MTGHTQTAAGAETYPPSLGQEGLWLLERLAPGSAAYHVTAGVRLDGPLEVGVLVGCLAEVAGRHEVLRSRFAETLDGPVASVARAGPVPCPVIDLGGVAEGDQHAQCQRVLAAEAARPFDLTAGPLFRAVLVRLSADRHVLAVMMHHIVTDGWSMGVLWAELAALYPAALAGRSCPLPPLELQYGDYAAWQRQLVASGAMAGQIGYWRAALAGAPAALELPADHPRPAVRTFRGGRHRFVIAPAVLARLRALGAAQGQGTTLFMTLLAAFTILLARYTGQDDVVVGSPIAGRTRAELEGLIGFFVNTLVLRTDLSGAPSFRDLLARVRDTALQAYAHQDLPFEKLVADLAPERTANHNPLFQVMFVLHKAPLGTPSLPGLAAELVDIRPPTAKFDLSLLMHDCGQDLQAAFEYDADLFEPATIERMAGHFSRLLTEITADPDRPVMSIDLLTPPERTQILTEWNDTGTRFPAGPRIPELIRQRARQMPGRTAVLTDEGRLSYGELDKRASQLAHHLRGRGVGPDVPVGVCMDRCPDLVVALLAVLKAGGAYVPLDPALPAERLEYMLADAAATVLLTHRRLDALAALEVRHADVIYLDEGWPQICQHPAAGPAPAGSGKDLAYVIYTSGSTGKPKGVGISHEALSNLVFALHDWAAFQPTDVVFSVTSFCWDVFTAELFAPLAIGAQVVLASTGTVLGGGTIAKELELHQATVMQATPGVWETLIQAGWPGRARLRAICTGEALPAALGCRLAQRAGKVWNLYGPTEATIYSTGVRELPECADQVVPIGRPIANTRVYVLDRWLRPVPVGVSGELFIGGAGVARGYLGRPGLTADRFIPDPFGPPGQRLYRTGDLARWQPDGSLRFLGRLDRQLKIRGYRVEPGEIEAALAAHPQVAQVRVAARQQSGQAPHLVAYLAAAPPGTGPDGRPPGAPAGPAPSAGDLLAFARQRIPQYLLPSRFVILDQLPLTASGKIDDQALARLDLTAPEHTSYIAPRTPAEDILAGIWAEVLGLQRISIHDDFFTLGGDSLRAISLLARIREVSGIDIPVCSFYQQPTIAGLVEIMTLLAAERIPQADAAQLLDEIEGMETEGPEIE
jgi:amino acid adenylation domain-containing protein